MDGQVGQWQVPLSLEKEMSHFPNGQSMAMLDMCEKSSLIVWNAVIEMQRMQSLGARLARGYAASKCPSRYPITKRSQSYCQSLT